MTITEPGWLLRWTALVIAGATGVPVFALDRQLDLPTGTNRDEVLSALKGHVLARGELLGIFKRPESPARP